ncbi:SIMPL domain-containing protein [Candidatus Nomurabacteria bacterium]|nr:SIMPL domain-containing protein [Candidatus Nomurabacteria bacterium]
MEITNEQKGKLFKIILIVGIILALFLGVKVLSELKNLNEDDNKNINVISFTGHGEVNAVPDIANISFTIHKEAKTVKEAQDSVAQIENKSLSFLRGNKIEDKDIKTQNASFNPKYDYTNPCLNSYPRPCDPVSPKIVGYEAYESISVKIRNTDNVGTIMQGLGSLSVTDLSGPNFSIDDEDALKAEARKQAIDDAKEKAKSLARDLGVHLGKITSFNENGNYPMPMYAKTDMAMGSSAPAVAELPKGENTITSDVTITFEIR